MSRTDAWAELAAELGFEFHAGVDGFLESPAGRRELEERVAGGELPAQGLELLRSPLVRAMLEMLFDGIVVGTHRGVDFNLYPSSHRASSSGTSTPYSNVSMIFERSYDLGLHIYQETFLSRVGKALFFQQDVQLGHPVLDKLVMIKGKDAQAVQALLGGDAVQEQLVTMFQASQGWEIRDQGIKHREVSSVISRERAVGLMDAIVDLTERLPRP